MAEEGLGAAILPAVSLPKQQADTVRAMRIVNPEIIREIGIITVKGTSLSPASQRLAQLLKELLGAPEPEN